LIRALKNEIRGTSVCKHVHKHPLKGPQIENQFLALGTTSRAVVMKLNNIVVGLPSLASVQQLRHDPTNVTALRLNALWPPPTKSLSRNFTGALNVVSSVPVISAAAKRVRVDLVCHSDRAV
jgi:hypothetical protein